MSLFAETLLKVPAAHASKILGVPLRTIYSWRNGEVTPNAWTQRFVMANLRAYAKLKPAKAAK